MGGASRPIELLSNKLEALAHLTNEFLFTLVSDGDVLDEA